MILRGLSRDREQRYATMDELLAALKLEQGDNAGGSTLSRDLFLRWFFGTAFVLLAILQIRTTQGTLTLRGMAIASVVMLAVVLGAGFYRRKTLLANRFHRSMWLICVMTVSETILQRAAGAKLGLPPRTLFPFEMIVLAASTGVAGMFLFRWMLWVPLVPLLLLGLSLWGLIPERFLVLAHLIVLSLFVLGWSRAARRVETPQAQTPQSRTPTQSGST